MQEKILNKVIAIALSGALVVTGSAGIVSVRVLGPITQDNVAYASAAELEKAIAVIEAMPDASKVTLADDTEAFTTALMNLNIAANNTDASEVTPALFNRFKSATDKANAIIEQRKALREAGDAAFLKTKVKGVKVKVGKRKAKISWKKTTGATSGYQVYMSKKKKSGYKLAEELYGESKNKVTVGGLKKGQRYYFKVRALRFPISDKYDDGSEKDLKSKFSTPVRSKKIK